MTVWEILRIVFFWFDVTKTEIFIIKSLDLNKANCVNSISVKILKKVNNFMSKDIYMVFVH